MTHLVELAREFLAQERARATKETKEVGKPGSSFVSFVPAGDPEQPDPVPPEAEPPPEDWPLEEINRRAVVLEIHSRVLDREVLFVPDSWRRPVGEARPAFAVSELRRLAKIRPRAAELRLIAEVREVFGGQVSMATSANVA